MDIKERYEFAYETISEEGLTMGQLNMQETIKCRIKGFLEFIMKNSIDEAVKEQRLKDMIRELERIVPDITFQYSTVALDTPYRRKKARAMHAFQVALVKEIMDPLEKPMIVDVGDSAGTHLKYLIGLYPENKGIRCMSVNMDQKAVDRIRGKGLDAMHARAEDLHEHNIEADVFLCFQTLEHLMDPFKFLHALSSNTRAKYLVITVPYVRESRVGLYHIRQSRRDNVYAENTHIFELDPDDIKLVVKHAGWSVVKEKVYLQYPKRGILRMTKMLWRALDFEGFYGLILERDDSWSSKYADW